MERIPKELLEQITANKYYTWKGAENKCPHNQWDIALNMPICTHPFIDAVYESYRPMLKGVILVCFSNLPNIAKYCPKNKKDVNTPAEYAVWFKNFNARMGL